MADETQTPSPTQGSPLSSPPTGAVQPTPTTDPAPTAEVTSSPAAASAAPPPPPAPGASPAAAASATPPPPLNESGTMPAVIDKKKVIKPTKAKATTPPPAATSASPSPAKTYAINTDKQKKVYCHTFKLLMEKMVKNILAWRNKEQLVDAEHVHFFHSIISQGRANEHCSKIGGHMHAIEMEEKDGRVRILSVGPAVQLVKGRIKPVRLLKAQKDEDGDMVKPAKYDKHTHDVEYLNSDEIEVNIK